MTNVIIVGAGISGLAVAYRLQERLPDADVTVLEQAERPGGTAWTVRGTERSEIERRFVRARRHAESAADVDRFDAAESFGEARELGIYRAPVRNIEDAGAEMRVQPDDMRAMALCERAEFIDLIQRESEFRCGAAGLDLVVMTTADAKIDAQMNFASGEHRAPL